MGPEGPMGPAGPGGKSNPYAQFIFYDQCYEDGAYISLYPYFSGGGDISLQPDNMTLKLAKGGVYLFSFSASATVNAGGYFKITPVIGVSDEGVYAFTAQSKTVSAAISVANTFLFYAPVDFYLRLKLNARCV